MIDYLKQIITVIVVFITLIYVHHACTLKTKNNTLVHINIEHNYHTLI